MHLPKPDPRIAAYILRRYPRCSPAGVASMWVSACCWVEENAPYLPESAPAFGVAALFRVQAICEHDPQRKAAFLFSASEAIAPYQY